MNRIVIPAKIQKHIDWLVSGPSRLPNGMLAAWTENGIPSYPYEESTGYLISLFCMLYEITGDTFYRDEAEKSIRALADSIKDKKGAGRDGNTYFFDTAICLRAALRFVCTFGTYGKPADERVAVAGKLEQFLYKPAIFMAREKQAVLDRTKETNEENWSNQFNIHLIKALEHLSGYIGSAEHHIIITDSVSDLISRKYKNGYFYLDNNFSDIYVHPHCYAIEGLLGLSGPHNDKWADIIREASRSLADVQMENGGIPCRLPVHNGNQPASDSTAQAVRIWQCVSRDDFADNIEKGISFLLKNSDTGGGIHYCPGSNHLNSWATIFTIQALLWEIVTADARTLI